MPLVEVIQGDKVVKTQHQDRLKLLHPRYIHTNHEQLNLYRSKDTGMVKICGQTQGQTDTQTGLKQYAPYHTICGITRLESHTFTHHGDTCAKCQSSGLNTVSKSESLYEGKVLIFYKSRTC